MKFKTTVALGAASLLAATFAFADSHVDPAIAGAIKARQAHMDLYAFNLGTLGAMAQENIPYDADAAAAAAGNLAMLASLNQSNYWPQGSDTSIEGSRALPALWENIPDAIAKGEALATAAAALAEVAGTDLASLQGAFGPVGGACGDCHRAYRQSN